MSIEALFTLTPAQKIETLLIYRRISLEGAFTVSEMIRIMTPSWGESGARLYVERDVMLSALGAVLQIDRATCKASVAHDPVWTETLDALLAVHAQIVEEVETP